MKTSKRCRHAKKTSRDRGYFGPVRTPQNMAAHGGICIVETCETCGAERRTNVNGGHSETSGWQVQS